MTDGRDEAGKLADSSRGPSVHRAHVSAQLRPRTDARSKTERKTKTAGDGRDGYREEMQVGAEMIHFLISRVQLQFYEILILTTWIQDTKSDPEGCDLTAMSMSFIRDSCHDFVVNVIKQTNNI